MGHLGLLALICLGAAPGDRILWVPGPVDNGLLERLDGQLSDLRWRLQRGSITEGPEAAPANASAVVWFERVRYGLRLRLALPDGRRWRRDIEDLGAAATQEAAALVVRSALLAIEEGIAPAWTDEVTQAPPPPPPPPEPAPTTSSEEPEESVSVRGWGWAIGGRTEANGVTVVPGLTLGVFRRWNSITLGLRGAGRLPYETTKMRTALRIGRYDVAVQAAWDRRLSTAWTLGASAAGGAAIWRRETERTDLTRDPEDARWLVSGITGLRLRVGARIASGWALMLAAGADALWSPPNWTLDDGTTVAAPWAIQPTITVGLAADPLFDDER